MWSPSSLIFIVLLGVWAAYFLQYWIRRRDHLATARSVEQFSEAMRVLERRDTTPRTDLSEPAPRSWNVHPAKATTRPQVLVKRAVASVPAVPMVTARIDDTEPAAPSDRTDVGRPSAAPQSAPALPRTAPAARRSHESAARAARLPAPKRVRPSRRVRSLLMLLALTELVAISVLVALGSLALWALAPAVVALLASFAFVRAGVRAEQRLRAARRRAARAARPSRATAPRADRAPAPRSRPAATTATVPDGSASATSPGVSEEAAASDPVSTMPSPEAPAVTSPLVEEAAAPAAVVEETVPEEPEHIEYVHLVDEDDIPLTWEPVPVPRPTYTMKARAERPEVAPAEVTPDPVPVALPGEDEDGVPERRVAGA